MSMRMSNLKLWPAEKVRGSSSWRPRCLVPRAMSSATRGGGERGDGALELAPGVVALGVEERGGEFDFERAGVFDQVDDGGGFDGLAGHEFGGGGAEFGAGGDGVVVGRGVFDQRGRGLDVAQEGVGRRGSRRPSSTGGRLRRRGRGLRRG